MKMIELVNASPALKKLATQNLGIKAAYDVSRVIKLLDEHLNFHDQKFNEMLSKYCEQDGDKWIPKTSEDFAAFQKEREELLDLEIEIGEFKRAVISIDENITLSAVDIMALENFVEIKFNEVDSE